MLPFRTRSPTEAAAEFRMSRDPLVLLGAAISVVDDVADSHEGLLGLIARAP
jgi:hypothetical protein